MEEWKTYRLGDVLQPKGYIRGPFGSALVRAELKTSGIPVYEQQHAIYNHREFRFFIDDIKYEQLKRFTVKTNDIIISCSGTVGFVSLIEENDPKGVISQALLSLRVNQDIILPKYLMYFLKSEIGHNSIISRSSGSVQVNIAKRDVIENIHLCLPPIEKQKKIVEILDSIDSKIAVNNRINHNLEEQAQALYKSWFVDFEPFKDGNFVESELGMIPEGWRVGSIYEYAEVIYGAPYKSTLFNESGDGLPLIRIRDLKDCSPQFYSPEVLPNTEYVLKGDIVAGMDADFTPYIWKGSKGLLNQRVCKFVPISESISRYYVMMMVKPELEFVSSYKVGTTVSHLGKSDIDRFTVLLPPVAIVERYSRIVDSILGQIVNNSTEATRLTEQRNSLLPQLMSGKITC